ncbi:MAG: hypothetical protein DRJ37_00075 [Thermoprotei archaeon]|nr:MAG: hypothetical protein DRJ37_00075 [Thermoprotei archaeon]
MKVIAVGDRETIKSLASLGAVSIVVKNSVEMYEVLQKVAKQEDVGLILLSEKFSHKIRNEIKNFMLKHPLPVIVEIPYRPHSKTHVNDISEAYLKEVRRR